MVIRGAAALVGGVLFVCSVQLVWAQESRDIPERYSRQVAPTPSTYWRSPDLRDYTRVLRPTEAPLIDPNKRYELPELIDLAQRTNPETRVAWEAARRAALAVGLVESEYFPVLAITALGGYRSVGVPIPKDLVSDGFFRFDLVQAVPALNLRWLLVDFGRRGSAHDVAKERLLAANLGFNRRHQQIASPCNGRFTASPASGRESRSLRAHSMPSGRCRRRRSGVWNADPPRVHVGG